MTNEIVLRPTSDFGCQWDDFLIEGDRTYVTMYTLENVRKGGDGHLTKPGITLSDDGIYDIVIDAPELTKEIVEQALKELSDITLVSYVLQSDGDSENVK